MTERRSGVLLARVFVDGKQLAKTFHGTQKAVRAEVAAWEAEVLGRSASHLGATVADLLTMWQEARGGEWQPTTVRDHRSRAARIVGDIGTVRLVDLDPLRVDAWLVQMRRRGVGAGAIRGRVSTLKADLPGVSGRDSSRVFWDRFGAVGLRPDPSLRADSARGQARRCADMGVRVSCCSGRLVLVFCGFLVCYRLVGGGWGAVQHQQGADHSGGAEDDEWPVMLGCAEHCPT
jgi:hypothetical protein